MIWSEVLFLIFVICFGYLPYKYIQKKYPHGLRKIGLTTSLFLISWMVLYTLLLLARTNLATINFSTLTISVFVVTTFLWVAIPFVIPRLGIYPANFLDKNKKLYTAELNPKTYYLKYFEVIFQQSKFLFLLDVVLSSMLITQKVIWFTIIIVIIHLGNLFFLPKKEALHFTFLSLPMAVIFGLLIVNGYLLLTVSIHLWFYIFYSCLPWFNNYSYSARSKSQSNL
jgi:hypothetical protein